MKISKDNIISVLLAIACGILSQDIFLRLYGVVFSLLVEINAYSWIKACPKSILPVMYWLYNFIVEMIVLAIIIIIIGGIAGIFIKIGKIKAAAIALAFFVFTKLLYQYNYWGEFSFGNVPIIYFLLALVLTFIIFVYSFYLGGVAKNKIR